MTKRYTGGKIFTALTYIFLYAPIIVLIVFLAQDSKGEPASQGAAA